MNTILKKFCITLLLAVVAFCATAAPHRAHQDSTKSIKILCLGNSFTCDAMSYVPAILKNVCPELKFEIGIGYVSGCSLVQHWANMANCTKYLNGKAYQAQTYRYYKFADTDTTWSLLGYKGTTKVIADEDWDVITLQQNSGASGLDWATYYAPFIYNIQNYLETTATNPDMKMGWLLIQGKGSANSERIAAWEGTAKNSKAVIDSTHFQVMFPYGTALQNLRADKELSQLGDYGGMSKDGLHLQEGLGCLVSAYANAQMLLNLAGANASILGDSLRPDSTWCASMNIPDMHMGTGVVGITEENCHLAQLAALMAIKYPYQLAHFVTTTDGTNTFFLEGDANGDENVDGTDLSAVLNHILGRGNLTTSMCDVYSDGKVNASDISYLINLILK